MSVLSTASRVWLCLTLASSAGVDYADAADVARLPLRSMRGRRLRDVRMEDMSFGPSQTNVAPGDRCPHYLWTGDFACCWTYKQVSRSYYSSYRYACISDPDSEDCSQASNPGDTLTTKFMDPHACRREIVVTRMYSIGMNVLNGVGPTVEEGETRQVAFRNALVDGLVAATGTTPSCIIITSDAEVTDYSRTASVKMTVKFRVDDELELNVDEAIISRNWTLIERANQTLINAKKAVTGDVLGELRSKRATEQFTKVFQELFNDTSVSVSGLSVNITKAEQYGQVFVDGAAASSVPVAVMLLSALAVLLNGA